jgi:hypothetical protein
MHDIWGRMTHPMYFPVEGAGVTWVGLDSSAAFATTSILVLKLTGKLQCVSYLL